jgi:hypothetical protein
MFVNRGILSTHVGFWWKAAGRTANHFRPETKMTDEFQCDYQVYVAYSVDSYWEHSVALAFRDEDKLK